MSLSSDQLIKQEIIDTIGYSVGNLELRIFPESSNFDQVLFSKGGLTFGSGKLQYGSCDAAWFMEGISYKDLYSGTIYDKEPIIALEGTDALGRGSSGNAQYQRFHHALGAVKNGVIGIYYLRPGASQIRPDLFYMAYQASQVESGEYIITDNLNMIRDLLNIINKYGRNSKEVSEFINHEKAKMKAIWDKFFNDQYGGDWDTFAAKRSTIIKDGHIIKYAGRMKRNFTDPSQRAGHIAVGEMYLTKYFFPKHKTIYLMPRMTHEDIRYLDIHKIRDKEWSLLRYEDNVLLATMDDIIGLPDEIKELLLSVCEAPLKGDALRTFSYCADIIYSGLKDGSMSINFDSIIVAP